MQEQGNKMCRMGGLLVSYSIEPKIRQDTRTGWRLDPEGEVSSWKTTYVADSKNIRGNSGNYGWFF